MVRLPHLWSWDIQGQETFLAPFPDKETRNYDTEIYTRNHIHSWQRIPNSLYFTKTALYCLALRPPLSFKFCPFPYPLYKI